MATREDITIDQGSRFLKVYEVTDPDLTGLSARMQIRRSKVLNSELLLNLDEYVTVDAAEDTVTVDVPGSVTEAASWTYGCYDIEVYDATDDEVSPVRVAQGDVFLDGGTTI